MPDPNWLLSSAAQSAAALVAIVGGFLASRVIALSTERDAAVRRLSDLYPKLEQARKRQQDVADELKSWDDWLKDAETLRQTLGEQQLAQLRELSDQRAEVSYRVRDLESQVEQAERYVASLRAPEDIWKGVVVLVYFAVVGIVFPLVMMAIQPEAVAAWARAVVVAAFVSGLAALAWYLVRLIRRAQIHVR